MLDGHIHINNQEYNLLLIERMIEVAVSKGIDELNILDHTHKFLEFDFLYQNLNGDITKSFYQRKKDKQISIKEYLDFISLVKSKKWPIKLNFGLEVCYFKEKEDELRDYLKSLEPFKFDFLIGSIHYVNGIGVDLSKEVFIDLDIDNFYQDYFIALDEAIHSKMFDIIAHPDLIKLFGFYPSFSLIPYYEHLAIEMKKYNQKTENNSGLIRYGYPYPGMAKELIDILKKYDVKFCKSSDAHRYEDIGRVFDDLDINL